MTMTISFDEQKELIEKVKQGDKEAARLLVEAYTPLVCKMAKSYNRPDIYEDLLQEGYYAILQAARKFDSSLGVSFFTYVFYWVKRNMDRCVLNHSSVKISTHSKLSDIPEVTSLDAPVVHEEDKKLYLKDILKSPDNVEEQVNFKIVLEKIVSMLNPDERKILLLKLQGHTLKEITELLGITERQLCFRLKKIKTKLQNFLKAS